MIRWFRIWIHCLFRTFDTGHRMTKVVMKSDLWPCGPVRIDICECEYNLMFQGPPGNFRGASTEIHEDRP